MRIIDVRALRGANVYSHHPAMLMRLDLEDLFERESIEFENFNRRLLEILPGLTEHQCSKGRAGGFVERLGEGTYFGHIVEHAAIELINLVGIGCNHGKTRYSGEGRIYNVVVEYKAERATQFLLEKSVELVETILKKSEFSLAETIEKAVEIAAETELGPSGQTIVEAAEKRGIPCTRQNEHSLVQLGYGRNLRFVQAAETDATSNIAVELAGDKDATKQRLENFSISVPQGEIVRTEREAIEALESLGAPVVVKPLDGRQGKGVSLNLSTPAQVADAFRIAQEFSPEILVEEQFTGKNYRVLIVGEKMVAASERIAGCVVGDDANTIRKLIEIENQNPLRGEGHEKPLTKIKIDDVLLSSLRKRNQSLDDVPETGKTIWLREGINLSMGGTATDVTDIVHPSIKTMCERAARIVGLDVCGVDLVIGDISQPLDKQKGGVIELNAAPGLRMHTFPNAGKPRDVGGAIVEMLYPNNAPALIPIIAITGTNGKTTVTRMISHVLQEKNLNVGTTTTDGIYINDETITEGDTTGPVSAKTILGDKAIDVAVLETARGGIVRRGLGYDWSDVAVITNITADHLGQDGIETVEDLVWIKSLIAERVREGGTLILNADDEMWASVAERPAVKRVGKKIVYFSLDENNPIVRKHLNAGGTAYFVRENWIVEANGNSQIQVVKPAAIPATMNGAAEYQIANAMAAIAACRAHGVALERIKAALGEFQNETKNPGRTNFYRVERGHVLVDYGHNPGAFAAICRMAARLKGKRTTGIIGVPGDRNDALIRESGRVAANGFDRIIIKEDVDKRGRTRGEVARLLCETIAEESAERECSVVINEVEAFENELKNIRENDVVVIFYDKLKPILEVLAKYNAVPVNGIEQPNTAKSKNGAKKTGGGDAAAATAATPQSYAISPR
jgi:cyanophycin synthetase